MKQQLNRREWLAASGLATLAACSRNRGTGYYGYALVASAGDNSLAAVDLTAFRVTGTIGLDASPSRVLAASGAAIPDQAYVLTPSNGTIQTIDSQLKKTISRRMADFVSDIALSADGKSIYALAPHSRELILADSATLRPSVKHRLSLMPASMDFSSTGYAAVASTSGAIELLNLKTGQRTHAQSPALGAIRFRSDGKLLLAANTQNRSLLALDVPTLQVVAELPLAMQPDHLCFNADEGQLFVTGEGMDGVAVVFPYNMLEVDQTLLAGRAPGAMACSATPAFLFVGSSTGSDVCILNIDTRVAVGFVDMGGRPSFIKVTSDNQYALVFDQAAGDMGVIHIPWIPQSGTALRLKTAAALFTMLSVGSNPVDAAIIPKMT